MSTQLQLRRGPTATVASTTGAAGELIVDTTTWQLYLQDGSTAGGHLVGGTSTPPLSAITAATANNSINNSTYAQEWQFTPNTTDYYGLKISDNSPIPSTGSSLLWLQGKYGSNNSFLLVTDEVGHNYLDIASTGVNFWNPGAVTIANTVTLGAGPANYAVFSENGIDLVTTNPAGNLRIDASSGAWKLGAGMSQGSEGQVLTANLYGQPTWATPAAGTVTDVTATSPLSSTGGATPDISISQANATTNGYLSSTDWSTFNSKGNGTVTSVAALTLGTTGTDLSSTVANGTTTPVITLNVPTASATNRGALSAADWTTFNNKVSTGANSSLTNLTGITGAITTPTYIDFATGATVTPAVGRLTWDATYGTLQFGLVGGNVNLQIGQEMVQYVLNKTGSNLLNAQIVRISGAQGSRPTVALAQADTKANAMGTIGMLTENINNNQEGFVTTYGIVHDVNTGSFADGDTLYLSATTPGGYTNVQPASPAQTVIIGYVIRAHATVGQILIDVQGSSDLTDLADVDITSPTNGQLLTYDSTAGYWKNAAPAYTGTITSVGGTGSVNGITLSGTVTSSGNLTLGGTLSGIGNSQLTNSSVTVNGTSIALGASGTVTAAAGTLTGTTLNATVTGSSLTSFGTVTSGYVNPNVQGPTSVSGSTTINWAQKDVTKLTLTGSTAITNSGAVDGQKMILQLVQGGSGSYTVTFTSETKFGTSFTSITLSTAVGAMDMVGLVYSAVNSKYNIVSFAAGY